MKLNIAYPETGLQKLIDIEDDNKLRILYDKRISHEVDGDFLGDEFKGYRFRISGGNDKQGFPMKQGVLTSQRVRLLLRKGVSCYRPRRRGERKRKSVRGCIVSADLSVLSLVIVKKGEGEIPGLTDSKRDRRLGPKRAQKIRKLFALTKEDDVRQYVVAYRRKIDRPGKKSYSKCPKIQRLITPERLARKKRRKNQLRTNWERSRKEAERYNQLLAAKAKKLRDAELLRKERRRSKSRLESTASDRDAKRKKKKVMKVNEGEKKKPKEPKKQTKQQQPKKAGKKKAKGKKKK